MAKKVTLLDTYHDTSGNSKVAKDRHVDIEFPKDFNDARDSKETITNARYLADAWRRNGVAQDDTYIPWSGIADALISAKRGSQMNDTVTSGNLVNLLEVATSMIVREPIEPILAITGLFSTIRQKHMKTEVITGVIGGAVSAGEYDEGGNPPEVSFDMGGNMQVAVVGKTGIMASFTDEALRYCSWDLMGIYMRLLAAAMARHTEKRAIDCLRSSPAVLFDNITPASSLFGSTSGRAEDMTPNGTLTADDLFDAICHAYETGYPIDTMVINPQIYFMWVRDPVLRLWFLNGNSNGVLFGSWSGNPAPLPGWSNGPIGAMGESHAWAAVPEGAQNGESATPLSGFSNVANSAPNMPKYWGISLRTVVSPLMPYDPANRLCDIFLLNSGSVGLRIIDEDVTRVEWRDEDKETVKVKFRQRDAFALMFEGAGVYVIRNIKNAQNFYPGKTAFNVDVSNIEAIDHSTVPASI